MRFARRFPDRHINFGVAEQDMLLAAAGMASAGLIPLACTYATFATLRGCEQIRSFICYGKLNVKVICSHGGLEVGWDGPTHQGIEDIAIMRSLPNMTVVVPADATAVPSLLRQVVALDGPVYFRMGRNPVPVIYGPAQDFTLGKAVTVREGGDVTLIACGRHGFLGAGRGRRAGGRGHRGARARHAHGQAAGRRSRVRAAAEETGAIVTAEDHTIIGGLGGAWPSAWASSIRARGTRRHPGYLLPLRRSGGALPDVRHGRGGHRHGSQRAMAEARHG